MKRIILFTTILATLILLVSCALPTEDPSAQTEAETPQDTPILDFSKYEYRYTNARESNWERDIVYLANTFFNKHAKLIKKKILTWVKFEDTVYVDMRDETASKEFANEIYGVIEDIPKLTDEQILYRLQKAVAVLNDAHSSILATIIKQDEVFPLGFEMFYTDDGFEFRLVESPNDLGDLLLSKLKAINGIPTEDVIDRLAEYIPSENNYAVLNNSEGYMLNGKQSLAAAGIIGWEDTSADFTFELDNGSETTRSVSVFKAEEWRGSENKASCKLSESDALAYKNAGLNYWYEYLPEDNMIYIRLNSCVEMRELSFSDFFGKIREDEAFADGVKIAIDLRDNSGGVYPMPGFVEFVGALNGTALSGLYVLINEGCYSSSVDAAAALKTDAENAVLVGTPAGQPANILGDKNMFTMPNCKVSFSVSKTYYIAIPDYPYDALMPDITVYQTVEDYKNGVDTVLEAIKDMD